MIHYRLSTSSVRNQIYIPKYYDPTIQRSLRSLDAAYEVLSFQSLVDSGVLAVATGDEIGKIAYGTGDIPFVRTSDIANWEIKTTPKQGVSLDIYDNYRTAQDVKEEDILLVRDGTYLIGTNCFVGRLDTRILYQSHILKLRMLEARRVSPYLLFVLMNSPIVQRQFRNVQFTADTIDTMGNRFFEVCLPIPRSRGRAARVARRARLLLSQRQRGKAFVRHAPVLMETVLRRNSVEPIQEFMDRPWEEIVSGLNQETTTSEFAAFETFWTSASRVSNRIYLPKYYAPAIEDELRQLAVSCDCVSIGELVEGGVLSAETGDEIGKMAYGTGTRPFVRTSDLANWEIKYDPKQGVSDDIFEEYSQKQDVRVGDVLLVRDGTYLVGTSGIVTRHDARLIYCGGIYRLRVLNESTMDCWLLLALLNSYIVKRQLRSKQFTRDVIDTLGKRLMEVVLPVPKSHAVRQQLSERIAEIVLSRGEARGAIARLAEDVAPDEME